MSEFDTHGGYFAPQGYMRVNAGGSHEENPNGGVQVGVDPEGTPNLLEEGEPVYNDYVYSDNITAEEDVLKSHNLPHKYAGKLYSEIADTFVDDAAETPLDPISNNGLNAMLVRLAEAQEEQKAIQQQRELEEELANLSPEELAELEQMLSQEEAAQQQPMLEEAMQAPVEAPMEAPVEQQQLMPPMMANGGDLRRERDSTYQSGPYKGQDKMSVRLKQLSREMPSHIGIEPLHPLFGRDHPLRLENLLRPFTIYGGALIDTIKDAIEKQEPDSEREHIMQKSEIEKANGERLNLFALGNPLKRRTHYRSVQWPYENAYNQFDAPIYDGSDEPITPLWNGVGSGYGYLPALTGLSANQPVSTMARTTLLDTYNQNATAPLSPRNIGSGVTSRSSSSSSAPTAPAATTPASPAAGSSRRRNTSPLPAVVPAIPSDYTVPDNIVQILDSDEPGLGFGVNPRARDILGRALATAQTEALPRPTTPAIDRMDAIRAIMANQPERPVAREDNGLLPVWPRYAGAVTSGLLGLYNAFQEPDRYEIPEYNPVLPQARMHFIDPIYNPLDQNQAVNDVLAANAGTARAITNSGLGASTQATLLANDYNAGRNMGAARAQVWDANNQRLNDVIARRNQNAGMLGQFDYGQSRDRAYIKNDAAWKNLQMALQEQRLNYAAEGQKYAAIQNQIDSVAQALSNIGRENAAMNMVNGDEAYRYALSRLFDPYYKGTVRKCGGYIKKIKK